LVVVERKFLGLARYRVFFHPTAETVRQIANGLGRMEMARLFQTQVASASGRCVVRHHLTTTSLVDMSRGAGAVWAGFESNCRNQIRKAEKLANRITLERNGRRAESDFLTVFNESARVGGAVRPVNPATVTRFRSVSDLFVVYLDGEPTVVNLVVRDEQAGRARGTYLGRRRFEDPERAKLTGWLSRYMIWDEMQHYLGQGFSTFDLGGVRPDGRSSVSQFKLAFGGDNVTEYSYFCAGSRWLGALAYGAYERLSASAQHMVVADTAAKAMPERGPALGHVRQVDLPSEAESEPT
jgi:hypothetical protein